MTTIAVPPSPININNERLPAPQTATAAPQVEIGGHSWRVIGRETMDDWQRWSPRLADYQRQRGRVAKLELRRGQRGRRPYVAYQMRDGSYGKPWPGTLVVD